MCWISAGQALDFLKTTLSPMPVAMSSNAGKPRRTNELEKLGDIRNAAGYQIRRKTLSQDLEAGTCLVWAGP